MSRYGKEGVFFEQSMINKFKIIKKEAEASFSTSEISFLLQYTQYHRYRNTSAVQYQSRI